MTGHRRPATGWGPALRIARRELLRAKGRTVLVLLMVLLPLTAVVGLDTLLRTADVGVAEGLPRDLGAAEARIDPEYGTVLQTPDGSRRSSGGDRPSVLTEAQVAAALDPAALVLPLREGRSELPARTADGRTARVTLLGLDLRDPARRGPYTVLRGRAPATTDEVAVTPQVERFGFPAGSTLLLPGGLRRTVVGTVLYPRSYGAPRAVLGLPDALGMRPGAATRFYVSGTPVTWEQVRQLNALGAAVLSRSVVLDPPPDDQVPDLPDDGEYATTAALVGLIAVIAVLEVVLLAGPAFAVGARRQRRALALMAAGGAEPRHVRRVVLAQGALVGGTAALLAAVLGTGGAALLRAPLTRWADASWGPFDVSLRDVVLLCLLGAGTALLAALAPAVLAARQPVVAALHGRRTTSGRAWLPAAVGAGLLVLGVVSCWRSVRDTGNPEFLVAVSAVPTVLGAAALAPALLHLTGRLAGRLPLPLRFAVRDADRQRGRTAPAVAAVTAVVAGVVALATAAGSDLSSLDGRSVQDAPRGAVVVTVPGPGSDLAAVAGAARAALPGGRVLVVPGIPLPADETGQRVLLVCRPEEPAGPACQGLGQGSTSGFGSDALVGEQVLPLVVPGLTPAADAAARASLRSGHALVAGAPAGTRLELRLVDRRYDAASGRDRSVLVAQAAVVADPLPVRQGRPPALAVLPDRAATALGGVAPVSVAVPGSLDGRQRTQLQRAVQRVDSGASVDLDRQPEDREGRLVLLLLGLGAGFLVLAGSLAATSLALTEARPDLATMGQVGARPRTRRLVAASYAFVLALVGALLGCAAGIVPGVAGAVAITRDTSYAVSVVGGTTTYTGDASVGVSALDRVDVPWLLLLGLLVVLPLLTAAVAGLSVRSALPGAGRRVAA